MTEPDYKAMWEEAKRQVTTVPGLGSHVILMKPDLARIEKKHTPKPKVDLQRILLSVTYQFDSVAADYTEHEELYPGEHRGIFYDSGLRMFVTVPPSITKEDPD